MLQVKKQKLKNLAESDLTIDSTIPNFFPDLDLTSRTVKTTDPKPWLYVFIIAFWILLICLFQPRLFQLLDMAYNMPSRFALWSFILFIDFAWLYGVYNLGIVLFAVMYKLLPDKKKEISRSVMSEFPAVAILYTTCNDFIEESVQSCIEQDYPNFQVYILDDSSDPKYKNLIDEFADDYPELVTVVRRKDRRAFKAGNMNHGLTHFAPEPYFAIADADEILPKDFLTKLVPVIENDPACGFVQANHRANPNSKSELARDMGVGIDLHWKWYQPLRNDFGFVMFLGHGALLRRKTWEEIGGFPDIVSEDLGFAIHAREMGYRGKFVEDVICYEDFPDTVRAFRIRHMKWTRGTAEFLRKRFRWLIRARNITWQEKLDILFPTLNLPLTLLYFLFMINANLVLPYFFGEIQKVTFVLAGTEWVFPVVSLDNGFTVIYDWDFFLITMLTFFSPVLCFIIGLADKPIKMLKFLSKSTALYAALSPLSSIGIIAYLISGKAIFLVTGDISDQRHDTSDFRFKFKNVWNKFINRSHPDSYIVQGFEVLTALVFGIICFKMFQISFFGLCLAFAMLPVMHRLGWENRIVKKIVHIPFILIMAGIFMASLSMIGIQAIFFGYGFHF